MWGPCSEKFVGGPPQDQNDRQNDRALFNFCHLLTFGNFDLIKPFVAHVWGLLKCGDPCLAEHVRTFINPDLHVS